MVTFKEELMRILEEQLDILANLDRAAVEKTELIIDNDVDRLNEMITKEEKLIDKIASLELEREHLLDSWGITKGMPLSTIISEMPGEKKDIEILGEKLSNILISIDEKNKTNNFLIKDSLEWIEFNLNLMTNATTPYIYGNENKKTSSKNNFFDRQV